MCWEYLKLFLIDILFSVIVILFSVSYLNCLMYLVFVCYGEFWGIEGDSVCKLKFFRLFICVNFVFEIFDIENDLKII